MNENEMTQGWGNPPPSPFGVAPPPPSGPYGGDPWAMPPEKPKSKTPWIAIAAIAGVVVIVLAVIGTVAAGHDGSKATATTTTPPTSVVAGGPNISVEPGVSASTAKDAIFTGTLHDCYLKTTSDACGSGILAITPSAGHEACSSLQSGSTGLSIGFRFISEYNLTAHDAGFVVGVAVTVYCPEYTSQVKAEANSG